MAFTPMTDVLNVHQTRATNPTETPSELKVLFDTDVNTVKTRHNELIAELNATTDGASGADKLGMTPISGISATTPQGALEELKSNDTSTNVKLTGNQTVAGVKTFSSSPVIPTATTAMQATTKAQVEALDGTSVKLTGTQTIAGVKTFSSSPVIPETPTSATQAASKGYVDTSITGVGVGILPEGSVTDTYLSNTAGQIKNKVSTFQTQYEYQTPVIVGRQIQVTKQSNSNRIQFKLTSDITGGSITISLDSGATALPLKDILGVAITELSAGLIEVVYDTSVFILKTRESKLEGTAMASDVLSGKTFYKDDPKTLLTGTLIDGLITDSVTSTQYTLEYDADGWYLEEI